VNFRHLLGWVPLTGGLLCVLALALHLSSHLSLQAQSPPQVGPAVGLRIPIWDYLNNRYWTEIMRMDWEQSFGLRKNADMTYTLYAKAPDLIAGLGITIVRPAGGDGRTQISVDTAIILNLQSPGIPLPEEGSDCYSAGSGAVRVAQAGLAFCAGPEPRRQDSTGWQWKLMPWPTAPMASALPPAAGSPCGDAGGEWVRRTEGSVGDAYIYTCNNSGAATWALIPMP